MSPSPPTSPNLSDKDPVVITGISGRFPESKNIQEFWEKLMASKVMNSADDRRWPIGLQGLPPKTGKIPDASKFDNEFFGFTDQESNWMDPQTRKLHETTFEAILDSGNDPDYLNGTKTGVYIGFCYSDSESALKQHTDQVTPFVQLWPSRIANSFGFKGPALCIDTACASSFTAFNEAVIAIKTGVVDSAIVAGLAIHLKPWVAICFYLLNMISPDGTSKCMDKDANGYCRSEAIVSILLQRKSDAKRIYCEVLNVKQNNDGFKTEGITFPSMSAQKRLMDETYQEIDLDPKKIKYIEAHMTGTAAGDPVESAAIESVFCSDQTGVTCDPLLIGCLKSNMGHSEGASGLCAIIKACLIIKNGMIPPNINYQNPNPNIGPLISGQIRPVLMPTKFDGDIIPLSCFGFGGCNVHVVLKASDKKHSDQVTDEMLSQKDEVARRDLPRLITTCSRSKEMAKNLASFIKGNPDQITNDFLSLLQEVSSMNPIKGFNYRSFMIMNEMKEVSVWQTNLIKEKKPLFLILPGFPLQWNGISKSLLYLEPFKDSITKSGRALNADIEDILFKPSKDVYDTVFANIIYQIALIDLINDLGLKPEFVIGTSIGEISAAYFDEYITREEALKTADLVGKTFRDYKEVNANGDEWKTVLIKNTDVDKLTISLRKNFSRTLNCSSKRSPPDVGLKIHGVNSCSSIFVAGPALLLNQFLDANRVNGHNVTDVHTNIGSFNGEAFKEGIDRVFKESGSLGTRTRSSKWLSTCIPVEDWFKNLSVHPTNYFMAMMKDTIRLDQVFDYLPKNSVCLELSPGFDSAASIRSFLRKGLGPDSNQIQLVHGSDASCNNILLSIGQLYLSGHDPVTSNLYPRVNFPVSRSTASLSPLIKWNHDKDHLVTKYPEYFYAFTSVQHITIDAMQLKWKFLTGHCIDGRILFPATGYLWIVWAALVRLHKSENDDEIERTCVEFFNVNFSRATVVPRNKPVGFKITFLPDTGSFLLLESDAVCVSGQVKLHTRTPSEQTPTTLSPIEDTSTIKEEEQLKLIMDAEENNGLKLASSDIYKELRVRGYDYGPTFQGLIEASSDGSRGKVKWMGNWINFSDAVLQLAIFGTQKRSLLLPTSIDYLKCDLARMTQCIKLLSGQNDAQKESLISVIFDLIGNVGVCNGLILKGLKASPAPRRTKQIPLIEVHSFESYHNVAYEKILAADNNYLASFDIKSSVEKVNADLINYDKLCCQIFESKFFEMNNNNSIGVGKDLIAKLMKEIRNPVLLELLDTSSDTVELKKKLLSGVTLSDDYLFTSYNSENVIRSNIDIVLENVFDKKISVLEIHPNNQNLSDQLKSVINSNLIMLDYSSLNVDSNGRLNFPIKELKSDLVIFQDSRSLDPNFRLESDNRTKVNEIGMPISDQLKRLFDLMKDGSFLLFISRNKTWSVESMITDLIGARQLHEKSESIIDVINTMTNIGLVIISTKEDVDTGLSVILSRKPNLNYDVETISVTLNDYAWIEDLKKAAKLSEGRRNKRIWLLASDSKFNGVIGLMNCLKKEESGKLIRCLFDVKDITDANADHISDINNNQGVMKSSLNRDLIEKDLTINVIRNGVHGSYRYRTVEDSKIYQQVKDVYLDVATKGDLSSLIFKEINSQSVKMNAGGNLSNTQSLNAFKSETRTDVAFAALNFKDVMVASGRIPLTAYPSEATKDGNLGMEFSGIDSSGRRVMGMTFTNAIATSVSACDLFTWSVPDNMCLKDAATIPTAYTTVYYSLIIRGQLMRGESILIHAGTGGVGQAAIRLALSLGCNVFTTVGTRSKREFIQKTFPSILSNQILNSRDTNFELDILRITNGQGVDVILNSLAEDKMKASFRCLSPFGRFLEIGKYDIIQNNPFDKADFADNKIFHTICLAHLMYEAYHDEKSSSLQDLIKLRELIRDGLKSGVIKPLAYHVFDRTCCEDAFRFMASGKHMGKVLIDMQIGRADKTQVDKTQTDKDPIDKKITDNVSPTTLSALRTLSFDQSKIYIITGGIGGFGLEICNWMIRKGARNFIITSRSGIKTNYQKICIEKMEASGADIQVVICDVSKKSELDQLLKKLSDKKSLIGGVFHLAMVLSDGLLENQTVDKFESVCESKVQGTLNLDEATRSLDNLDYFVCFSSVASGRGNVGQSNYAYANSVMERVCEDRRKVSLPGLAIQWGAIGDVGIVAEKMGGNDVVIGGTVPQRMPSCFQVLEYLLLSNHAIVSSIVKADSKVSAIGSNSKDDLLKTVSHILGIRDTVSLDPLTTLGDLGMDSLMAVEIRQGLEHDHDMVLSVQEVRGLRIKDIQEMGLKIKNNPDNRSHMSDAKKTEIRYNFNFELLSDCFIKLNACNVGKPIFLLPGIEGDFCYLIPSLSSVSDRPVYGMNWIPDVDALLSIEAIADLYIERLLGDFPDTNYDLIGYSFGSLVTIEMALQLQSKFGDSGCNKIVILDASPAYLKQSTLKMDKNELIMSNQVSAIDILAEFASVVLDTSFGNIDKILSKLPEDAKILSVIGLLQKETAIDIEPPILMAASNRYMKKLRLIHSYRVTKKFNGNILLLRANSGYRGMINDYNLDYDLGKIVNPSSGSVKVKKYEGDHRSFLSLNASDVGLSINAFFELWLMA